MKDAWKIGMKEIERDELTASPVELWVMPVLIKGQCVYCDTKEKLGKYGDTNINVCEDCYKNGNLRKWLDNIGTEA